MCSSLFFLFVPAGGGRPAPFTGVIVVPDVVPSVVVAVKGGFKFSRIPVDHFTCPGEDPAVVGGCPFFLSYVGEPVFIHQHRQPGIYAGVGVVYIVKYVGGIISFAGSASVFVTEGGIVVPGSLKYQLF